MIYRILLKLARHSGIDGFPPTRNGGGCGRISMAESEKEDGP